MEGQVLIVDRDFLNHWKVKRLVAVLGEPQAPLYLLRLWGHCESRKTDTFALTSLELAAICEYQDNPDQFAKNLAELRFIEKRGKRIKVRGWLEKNGALVARWQNGKKGGRPRKEPRGSADDPAPNRKRTRQNLQVPADKPEGNQTRTAENHSSVVECSGVVPPTVPQGGPERLRGEIERICAIFGRKRKRVGNEAEHALLEVSPIPEDELRAVEWFYGLPSDDSVTELRVRRHDADRLILHWRQEVDRAERFRKKNGGGVSREKKSEPAGWREWLRKKYPGGEAFESFWALSADVQREFYADEKEVSR